MALTDNLVSYWKLDASSGNESDSHGSNTLTEIGTAGSTSGKLNGGRVVDGAFPTLDGFSLSDNSAFDGTDRAFTLALWINATSLSGEGWFLSKWGSLANREFRLYTTGTTLVFTIGDSSVSTTSVNWGSALSTGTWYHVCCWHDPSANEIGVVVNAGTPVTASWSTGIQDGAAAFEVGCNTTDGNNWQGTLDELGLWSRVLTSQERTDLYNSGNGLAYPFTTDTPLFAGGGECVGLPIWEACGLI